VLISAGIAVPAATAATTVVSALTSTLGTPAAASAVLGITVGSMPAEP